MTDKPLTALEKIEDNCAVAEKEARENKTATGAMYNEGKAMGYMRSHYIMKEELKRLRNLWQNNMLTYDSFNVGD
jgi:hypothetical protein